MRCSDLRTEKFVDLKHYAMHNKIYKQKICLNKSILHASVSSAANNLKNFLHLFIWGKGLRQICVSSPFLQLDQSFVSWELLLLNPSLFWIIGEGEVSVSKRFTLQPQVQGLQFQQQQHIYLQFEPAGWFYLYVTDYLDLCCKAPSGESPGEKKQSKINCKLTGRAVIPKSWLMITQDLYSKNTGAIWLSCTFFNTAYPQISCTWKSCWPSAS